MGAVASFVCMPVHEFMHGFAIPQNGMAFIGIIKENFSAYAFTNTCMTLPQCVCYYLVPAVVLGIFPLMVCIALRNRSTFWHIFLLAFYYRTDSNGPGLVWLVSRLERCTIGRDNTDVRRIYILVLPINSE